MSLSSLRQNVLMTLRGDLDIAKFYQLRKNALSKSISRYYCFFQYWRIMQKNGCSITLETEIGDNVCFPHFQGIFISYKASIGSNCVIFQQVTIGSNTLADSKNTGAPQIGNNVYIGAGAKILGNVRIGNNVRIGANCIVCQDISDNSTVVLNKPCVIVHDKPRDNSFVMW